MPNKNEELKGEIVETLKSFSWNMDMCNAMVVSQSDFDKVANKILSLLDKQSVPEWVSVEDRLPERCKLDNPIPIYVSYYGYCSEAYYSDEGEFMRKWDGRFYYSKIWGVTHWMPLPQPPQTEKDGE